MLKRTYSLLGFLLLLFCQPRPAVAAITSLVVDVHLKDGQVIEQVEMVDKDDDTLRVQLPGGTLQTFAMRVVDRIETPEKSTRNYLDRGWVLRDRKWLTRRVAGQTEKEGQPSGGGGGGTIKLPAGVKLPPGVTLDNIPPELIQQYMQSRGGGGGGGLPSFTPPTPSAMPPGISAPSRPMPSQPIRPTGAEEPRRATKQMAEVSEEIARTTRPFSIASAILSIVGLFVSLAVCGWIFTDANSRGMTGIAWAAAAFLCCWPVVLVIYLMARS
jgi:hypothetical protein